MPFEYAVSTSFGSQRAEIVKSNFGSLREAQTFADTLKEVTLKRLQTETGVMPHIQIWQLVRTL